MRDHTCMCVYMFVQLVITCAHAQWGKVQVIGLPVRLSS